MSEPEVVAAPSISEPEILAMPAPEPAAPEPAAPVYEALAEAAEPESIRYKLYLLGGCAFVM